jgi:hypothetical protein
MVIIQIIKQLVICKLILFLLFCGQIWTLYVPRFFAAFLGEGIGTSETTGEPHSRLEIFISKILIG